jgi:predicted  nucleic acid-binding Zn-ribbon protein
MKYIVVSSVPSETMPPANLASMIKQCEAVGRKDLADKIHMQWVKVLNKYPGTRVNWGAAVKIGGASIKKNVFGGVEFGVWFQEQQDLSPAQIAAAKKVVSILPAPEGTPALAIPKDGETPEDWKAEALQTKANLASAKKGFSDVRKYIAFLENEADALKKKIADYSEGGEKETTKGGKPHKLKERIPKWNVMLEAVVSQLDETKSKFQQAETGFTEAVDNYNHAPLTTVAYEQKAQENLSNILEMILDMKDLDKQKELLAKLNDSLAKQKTTASVEVVAINIPGLIEKVKAGFKALKSWLLGLNKSVNNFNKLASIRY